MLLDIYLHKIISNCWINEIRFPYCFSLPYNLLSWKAWEGVGVVASARKLIGATNPLQAEPGTIRGDLAVQTGRFERLKLLLYWKNFHVFMSCLKQAPTQPPIPPNKHTQNHHEKGKKKKKIVLFQHVSVNFCAEMLFMEVTALTMESEKLVRHLIPC